MLFWIVFAVVALVASAAAVVLLRRWREDRKAKQLLAAVYSPEFRRRHVEPDDPQDPWDAQRP